MLTLRYLGQVDIRVDGKTIEGFATRKAKALFIYLSCHPAQAFTRQHLAALLWGESSTELASRSLRQALLNLRKTLPEETLIINRDTVAFNSDHNFDLDLIRLERESDVGVYAGSFLQGFDLVDAPIWEEWLLAKRESLQVRAITLLEESGARCAERGDYALAVEKFQRALSIDPWREASHQALMRLYALNGDRAAALEQYEKCARALREGLNIEPNPETQSLRDRIFNNRLLTPSSSASRALAFVGRGEIHARLVTLWLHRRRAAARWVSVEGEAGIGKTRLLDEALRQLSARGARVARGQCSEFTAEIPYRPMVEALRQILGMGTDITHPSLQIWRDDLARLLPEARSTLTPAPAATDDAARQRLFESVSHFIAFASEQSPLVIFLDDVQWADRLTLDLLYHLLASTRPADFFLFTAQRPDEDALVARLKDMQRALHAQTFALSPLDDAAVNEIANSVSDDRRLAEWLRRESGGIPFVVSELLRDLQESGDLLESNGRWNLKADFDTLRALHRVDDLILQRVSRLHPVSARYLNVAAIIGQPFSATFLSEVLGETTEALESALSEWRERRLLELDEKNFYDFTHDKIQETVYHYLPPDMQKLWHERVGQTLVDRGDADSAQIAYHFERCFAPRRAAPYLQRAAEAAQQVFAQFMAIDCYRRLLLLVNADDHAGIWLKMARLQLECGQWIEAEESFRRAVEHANDSGLKARAWIALCDYMLSRARYAEAQESAQHAEEAAREANMQAELLEALLRRGWALCRLGQNRRAMCIAAEARQVAETPEQQAGCVELLTRVEMQLGQFSQALNHAQQFLELINTLHDENRIAVAHNAFGEAHRLRGDFEAAIRHYRAALAIVSRRKHRPSAIAYMSNLGGALAGAEDFAEAEKILREVLDMPQSAGWGGLPETYSFLAQTCLGQARLPQALEHAARSLTLARQIDQCDALVMAWRVLGKVKRELEDGNWKLEVGSDDPASNFQHLTSVDCFAESLRLCAESEMQGERAWTLRCWGDGGDSHKLGEARTAFIELGMVW
jgi:DNA-binding SARP family transcriptional activator